MERSLCSHSDFFRDKSNNMNEQDLYELLIELREAKRNGALDSNEKLEQQEKWRNTLDYKVLRTCVRHYKAEIRLETLALLVESKKSTLCFISPEFELIKLFLIHNLGEKTEFVPFIKKALKRLKESLAVLQRQLKKEQEARDRHFETTDVKSDEKLLTYSYEFTIALEKQIESYTQFFMDIRDLCVNNLYPDATYNRRKFSLQILCLMKDLLYDEFKHVLWRFEQIEKILECLLLDTYEPNKEMAFKIIKSITPDILRLDEEVVFKSVMVNQTYEMISVALELANSIRPIDSITAAYIFKICMLSSKTPSILSSEFNIKKYSEETAEGVTLQLLQLLLRELETSLISAKENIVKAVAKHSLYGYLFCVRSLLDDCNLRDTASERSWQETVARLISMSFELNQVVSVIVNNSSPEGHLPMDLSTQNIDGVIHVREKEMVTPQMVLLCSWRTVKEVSLLFGQLATKSPIQDDTCSVSLLTESQIIKIGEHLVILLCETKHRGAFEQAYVGFNQLCVRLWRLKKSSSNQLPKIWLHQILLAITGLSSGNSKLCATRRSAGVPFMIQALVSSEPNLQYNLQSSALNSVMRILLELAELENDVNIWQKIQDILYNDTIFTEYKTSVDCTNPTINGYYSENTNIRVTEIKTHALNILRALFRHAQLGDLIKTHIASGLIAAFKNYDGKTWAERNAATLLFSALIIRVFGVQRTKDHINLTTDNKMTGRIFFERYPILLPFLLDELQTFVSVNDNLIKPNVQSILLLLSRLYINCHVDEVNGNWKINEFIDLVSQCAKSPVYKTRDLAARALVPLLTESSACDIIKKLLTTAVSEQENRVSMNTTHGYMLQILEIVRRLQFLNFQSLESEFCNFFDETSWILRNLEEDSNSPTCFPLAAVYVDTLHELLKINDKTIKIPRLQCILHILKEHLIGQGRLKKGPGQMMYKSSAIKFITWIGNDSNPLKVQRDLLNISIGIYLHILTLSEADLQIITWSTIDKVLSQIANSEERRILSNHAINAMSDSTSILHNYNPDLQDAIFNFFYNYLSNDDSHGKHKVCRLVLNKIRVDSEKNSYCERVSYLRLLGKSYATLLNDFKDEEIMAQCKEDVYASFCDSSWIGSLTIEFLPSVFNIMHDLFYVNTDDQQQNYPLLDWWTTLLQLLIDDNIEVRQEASKLISNIEPCNELECISRMLPIFFNKFLETVGTRCPGVAMSALFYWSVSLLGDVDYEMDETDVFNKCRNYDCFEPVSISAMCTMAVKSIMQRYSIDDALPADATRWLNARLNLDFSTSMSFKEILINYQNYVPAVERRLYAHITDPTYKDKLLQSLSYQRLLSTLQT